MSCSLEALIDAIQAGNPLQRSFLENSLVGLRADERAELDNYLRYCGSRGLAVHYLAECYNTIVRDTLREQIYFQRHGRYRHSTYAAVANSVYQNDGYMRLYMFGLALTSFLWPNHREIHRFFLSHLPRKKRGAYLEVGPGHGIFLLAAMRKSDFDRFDCVDISPTSVAQTRDLVGSGFFGAFSNYRLMCKDFLDTQELHPGYSAIVMGEVLEHVENPLLFLRRVFELAAPGAFVFITTAINAPAIDHIFLFESPTQVQALCEQAGLRISDELVVPYPGHSIQESLDQRLPVNIALALAR